MTSDTRPSTPPLDVPWEVRAEGLARCLENVHSWLLRWNVEHIPGAMDVQQQIETALTLYSRLLEERVALESESELREAFGK